MLFVLHFSLSLPLSISPSPSLISFTMYLCSRILGMMHWLVHVLTEIISIHSLHRLSKPLQHQLSQARPRLLTQGKAHRHRQHHHKHNRYQHHPDRSIRISLLGIIYLPRFFGIRNPQPEVNRWTRVVLTVVRGRGGVATHLVELALVEVGRRDGVRIKARDKRCCNDGERK